MTWMGRRNTAGLSMPLRSLLRAGKKNNNIDKKGRLMIEKMQEAGSSVATTTLSPILNTVMILVLA